MWSTFWIVAKIFESLANALHASAVVESYEGYLQCRACFGLSYVSIASDGEKYVQTTNYLSSHQAEHA
jgi:hypothetical protein